MRPQYATQLARQREAEPAVGEQCSRRWVDIFASFDLPTLVGTREERSKRRAGLESAAKRARRHRRGSASPRERQASVATSLLRQPSLRSFSTSVVRRRPSSRRPAPRCRRPLERLLDQPALDGEQMCAQIETFGGSLEQRIGQRATSIAVGASWVRLTAAARAACASQQRAAPRSRATPPRRDGREASFSAAAQVGRALRGPVIRRPVFRAADRRLRPAGRCRLIDSRSIRVAELAHVAAASE